MKKQIDILETGGIVGRSPHVQALLRLLERVAVADTPLLVVGEPGTYKESFAEAVHQKGPRQGAPFLVVDCGSGEPNSLEIELFGEQRDPFGGDEDAVKGVFEAAAGGTVFLGEVGELSAELQVKLLRAIDRRQIRRVGGADFVSIDVRLIASTSRSLRALLDEKRIRPDVYYRLTTLQVRIPALRERLEDVPALVASLVAELGLERTREGDALLDPEFLLSLARYTWPGNVRQLRHHVERCNALGDVSLPPSMETFPSTSGAFRVAPKADSMRMMRVAKKA